MAALDAQAADPWSPTLSPNYSKPVKRPEIIARLHNQGVEPGSMAPDAFAQVLRQDFERMAKVVQTSGAKAD